MPETPSPKHGMTRPADGDFINAWPAQLRSVVDYLDPIISVAITDTPRPAAGVFGRWHQAVDGSLTFDTGSAWIDVPWGSIAATLVAGGEDPLVVSAAMLSADVALPPVGTQFPTAAIALPANGKWAWCDGSLIRADLYPDFVAALGASPHIYNAGGANPGVDGSGNQLIRLPNKAGRIPVGAGTATGATGATAKARGARAGAETAAIPNHAHTNSHSHSMQGHNHTQQGGGVVNGGGAFAVAELVGTTGPSVSSTGDASANTGNPTSLPSMNTMSPYEVDNWIVRIA